MLLALALFLKIFNILIIVLAYVYYLEETSIMIKTDFIKIALIVTTLFVGAPVLAGTGAIVGGMFGGLMGGMMAGMACDSHHCHYHVKHHYYHKPFYKPYHKVYYKPYKTVHIHEPEEIFVYKKHHKKVYYYEDEPYTSYCSSFSWCC